ncbi:MFS general substrate transporter [Cystobasidium minutum MCA 4210]|uniref:MFS general substrate transporter n=1 Tax=Cystobasidium minutum MCA 4210 TaxID=1397322 RepID=UPI0034CED6C9|eukprot:jgi/Rhomi1/165279/fgenesh1_kg.1_\
MASPAMHIKEDNEKPSFSHTEGEGTGLDSRTRSGDDGSIEMAPMQTPGKAWEKKTILKIDLRLLIILGLCYAVSLIDRTNISVARVAGMQRSLRLDIGERYSIISLLFFVPYIIFELPSNIVLKKVGTKHWLAGITLGFGVIMTGMAFVKNWWQLAICRVLLGLLESGFFPGCVYLVSCWYTRYETNSRMAVFYLTSMVISGFSNIIGYGMSTLAGTHGLLGWQWIFLLFGVITMALGIIAWFLIVEFPEKNKFLDQDQTAWVIQRIQIDRGDAIPDKISFATVRKNAADWKLWVFALMFMTATTGAYAFAYFLPVILNGQGYSQKLSLLLSAPPYVFAAIYTFVLAVISDKTHLRTPFIALSCTVCIIGLAVAAYAPQAGVRYFGTFLVIAGTQSNVPAVITYSQNNILGNSKRAFTSALVIGFGGIGGIVASTVYRQADYPRYIPGLWTTIGLNLMTIAFCVLMSLYFKAQNRKADEGRLAPEGNPKFRYTI